MILCSMGNINAMTCMIKDRKKIHTWVIIMDKMFIRAVNIMTKNDNGHNQDLLIIACSIFYEKCVQSLKILFKTHLPYHTC